MSKQRRIGAKFFSANRQRLIDALPSSIIVLAGNNEMQSSGDNAFLFRQESNFWWLSGLSLPDWWMIIDAAKKRSYLIASPVDEVRAIFDGQESAESLRAQTGIETILNDHDGQELLTQLAREHTIVYGLGPDPHEAYYHFVKNPAQKNLWAQLGRKFATTQDCRRVLARLRAIKSADEITTIKRAVALTVGAFSHVSDMLDSCTYEYEVEAEFSYLFRRGGGEGHAYDPIVAAGENACTLHYTRNDSRLYKKDLLLLDIGVRLDGYAADITRTYAVHEPNKRQIAVHAAVKSAHEQIIALLAPGLSFKMYQQQVDEIMQRTLHDLGLLKNTQNEDEYRRYFPHAIGHGLGVDVHDSLGGFDTLQPGMVLTVEPGIYINEEKIGIRIEDDILITETGHENLSAALSTDY